MPILDKLEDQRLKQLGLRLIYFEKPDALDGETRAGFERWNAERLLGGDQVPWLTLDLALEELAALMDGRDESERAHLGAHKAFLKNRLSLAQALFV